MKRTEWYSHTINPIRSGMYECLYEGQEKPVMRLWDRGAWWQQGSSKKTLFRACFGIGADCWRGVTK